MARANRQTVTNTKIRLYNVDAANAGGKFYRVNDNTWQEETVTWNNAPAADPTLLAQLGAVSANTWYEVDVTSLITGDGTYSFRISDSVGGADYSSKEGANDPELVLTLCGTPAPTSTPTPGPSATPTNILTPTISPTATATTPPPAAFNSATFVYDGDGKRVKSIFNSTTTTYFVGNDYEVTEGTVTKYYYAGAQRIAMRTNGTLRYILTDHLGSTSLTTDANGQNPTRTYYKAWGEVRYASDSSPTKYQYTGQFSYELDFGLYFYNARWYDPSISRFTSADAIIPGIGNSQAWDRYAYAVNSPLTYSDPSGHFPWLPILIGAGIGLAIGSAIVPNIMPWDPPSVNTNRVADPIPGENLTDWLINQMTTNATSAGVAAINENWTSGNPIKMDAAMQAWTSVVGTGAIWDFKVDLGAAGLQDVTLGDRTLNYDAVANIHFGYVGRAAGFDGGFLVTAAGVAQEMRAWETGNPDDQGTCNTTSWCDHPFATWSIRFGSYLYDRYKDNLNALDATAFAEALNDFLAEYGEPPAPPPGSVSQ